MKKGDIVLVKAHVETVHETDLDNWKNKDLEIVCGPSYGIGNRKFLCKRTEPKPYKAIVCGYSFRRTGIVNCSSGIGWEDYEPGYLWKIRDHKVWIVQPLITTRWLKPTACLEEDLEIIG